MIAGLCVVLQKRRGGIGVFQVVEPLGASGVADQACVTPIEAQPIWRGCACQDVTGVSVSVLAMPALCALYPGVGHRRYSKGGRKRNLLSLSPFSCYSPTILCAMILATEGGSGGREGRIGAAWWSASREARPR